MFNNNTNPNGAGQSQKAVHGSHGNGADVNYYNLDKENWIIALLGSTATDFQKCVGVALATHANKDHYDKTGQLHCYPSAKTLANIVRNKNGKPASEYGVSLALKKLEKLHFTELALKASRGRNANRYALRTPNQSVGGSAHPNPQQKTSQPPTGRLPTPNRSVGAKLKTTNIERAPPRPGGATDAPRAPDLWLKLVKHKALYRACTQANRKLYQGDLYTEPCSLIEYSVGEEHHRVALALLLATFGLPTAKDVAHRADTIAAREGQEPAQAFLAGEIARAVRGDAPSMPDATVIKRLHDRVTAQLAAEEKRRAAKAAAKRRDEDE